jgi:hypothetical protein
VKFLKKAAFSKRALRTENCERDRDAFPSNLKIAGR